MNGLAWMALAQLLFAGMNVCTRLGARDVPWSEVAAVRFLVGAVIAIVIAWHRGSALRVDVATLGATAPIFVALLSRPLLSEPVEGWVTFAVGLGFAGVVAVVRPSFTVAMPVALIATVGAAFYAVAMIWLRRIGPGESHEAVVLHFSLVALTTLLLVALPVWRWPDWRSGLLLLGAGIGGGGGQIAMTRAYSLHRAAPVSALSGLGIVLTYLLAIPALGDRPTLWQMLGSLLVIVAGGVLAMSSQPTPVPARAVN